MIKALFDQGLLLQRLVWVLTAELCMLQDKNLKKKTVLRTHTLQDLNVGQHHFEIFFQVGFQGSGQ